MPEDYETKAERFERKAAATTDPRERARLLKIAADYRALGRHQESHTKKPDRSNE
jgi:hypothetical protein